MELAADAEAILKELRPGIGLEGAETLRVTAAKRARIRELGNRRQALEDHLSRMGREAHQLELKLAARKERQAKLAVPHDPDALRLAISSAQKQGELEQELGTAVSELQALKEQTAIELQRLGLWSGALKELESLPMPSAETIDRFETASDGLERRLESLLEALGKAEEAGQELDLQLSELRMTGAVPSEADLENARSRRERGWMLVRRAWVDGVEEPEEWRGFDPANPLATAYEVSVTQADMVADRLRREADRVARQAALLAQREKVGAEREACRRETEAIRQKIQALDDDWRQLWQPLGISPLKPREMRTWVVKQDRLVQSAARLRAEEQRVAMLKERIEAHRSTLSRRLEQLGEQQAGAGETLESLIHRSQKVILDMEELAGKHREMQQALQQLEEDLAAVLREKEDAVNNLARWQGEWERAVTVLGLAGSASASEANLVLDKVEDLFRKIDKLAGLDGRIAGILRDGKEFERDVELLARRLAPELAGEPAGQVVQDLNGRLHKALEDSATLGELKGQRAEKEELIRQCQVTLQTAERQLRELCLEAECSRHEELEAIEERSGQARELLDQAAMLEKQLLDYCAGGSLETLIQEVDAVDADSLDFQIKSAEERLEDLGGNGPSFWKRWGERRPGWL